MSEAIFVEGLPKAYTYHSVHRPCYSLLPMGIKRSKIFRVLKSEAEQPNMF